MQVTIGNSFCKVEGLDRVDFDSLRDYVSQRVPSYGVFNVPVGTFLVQGNNIVLTKDAKGKMCPVFTRGGVWPRNVAMATRLLAERKLVFKGNWFKVSRYIDNRGNFPSGLLYYVKKWGNINKVSIVFNDNRIKPKPTPGMFKLRGVACQ